MQLQCPAKNVNTLKMLIINYPLQNIFNSKFALTANVPGSENLPLNLVLITRVTRCFEYFILKEKKSLIIIKQNDTLNNS